MEHPLEWPATHLKKSGYFCALQIIAGLVSANGAGVLFSRFQPLGYVAANPIGNRSGEEILHSIAVLARLSGDIEVISLIAPLAGAVIGKLSHNHDRRPLGTVIANVSARQRLPSDRLNKRS